MPLFSLNSDPSSFLNITTATTTVVKSGPGILKKIIFNTPIINSTITIYDNTSAAGTKIGTITLGATLLGAENERNYEARFSTGLTIVTTGTNNITVIYE